MKYRMLARHGWHKLAPNTQHPTPNTQHPQGDPQAREDWKNSHRKAMLTHQYTYVYGAVSHLDMGNSIP
jgi:hypothetical protein